MSEIFVDIGDTITINDVEYICCISDDDCSDCEMSSAYCPDMLCSEHERCDEENVIFKIMNNENNR